MLDTVAKIATIFSAVIALIALFHQFTRSKRSSLRGRRSSFNRNEVQLVLCIFLFFFLGLTIPQAIIPVFLILLFVVYRNVPASTFRMRSTFAILTITLAGLVGAYLSAFDTAAEAGLPVFYSRDFRLLDIWYLLN